MEASGVGAGPPRTAAPRAGSNAAPWDGQARTFWFESYATLHPACVQTASNAATLPPPRDTATAGSPVAGSVKFRKPWDWRSASAPIFVPEGDATGEAVGAGVAPADAP